MNFFIKQRILYLIIFVLIVLNIIIIVLYLSNNYNHKSKHTKDCCEKSCSENIGHFIKSELGLDSNQRKTLRERKNYLMIEKRKNMHLMKKYRLMLIEELSADNPDSNKINALNDSIVNTQKQMLNKSKAHFLYLYSICNKDQKKKLCERHKEIYKNINKEN